MDAKLLPTRHFRAAVRPGRRCRLVRSRLRLADGSSTTLHVASYPKDAWVPRVVVLERPQQLVRWCKQQSLRHAVVGGFFVRPHYAPLGVVRAGGREQPSIPVAAPWDEIRACVQLIGGEVRIARRDQLDSEAGDLLQAGPLLVCDGRRAVEDGRDDEGFSAGAHQFDSDITLGRYPRAALGVTRDRVLAVACDGRTARDAGLTLVELADALLDLGATAALNLDGGGSASLVYNGRLRNRPREEHGADLLGGRPIVTAIVFEPR
jgi:Phosphodiester glycosidase